MDAGTLKLIMVGIVLVTVFGVVPIIMALLSHQQKMAQLFSERSKESAELQSRLAQLELKLAALQQPTSAAEKPEGSN